MKEKLKRLFSPIVTGEPKQFTDGQLKAQINNNLTIMNWMWFILLMTLYITLVVEEWQMRGFWIIISLFILTFITSLHTSQKQNKILLEIRGGKNGL